jgi:O-antigen/teichoic acid export membrane protein
MQIFNRLLKSQTAKRVATVFFNNFLRQVLSLCITIFVARSYGATGRGEYALFSSLVTVIALICSLGLVNALVYMMKTGHMALKQAAMLLFAHSTAAIALIFSIVAAVEVVANPSWLEMRYSFWLIGVLFFLYYHGLYLNLMLTSHLLAVGDTRNHRRQMVAIPLVTLAMILCGYAVLGEEDFHPVLGLIVGECLTSVLMLLYLMNWRAPVKTPFPLLKDCYSYSLRSYFSGLTGAVLTKMDNLVLGSFAGVEALGFYASAKSLCQLVQSVPIAFSGFLFGLFVERAGSAGRILVFKSSAAILSLSLCLSAPIYVGSSWILSSVYGSEFTEAADALTILVVAAVAAGASNPVASFLNANNQPGASSLLSLTSASLSAALLFALVPHMSYNGAAYATLIGSITLAILRYCYFLRIKT